MSNINVYVGDITKVENIDAIVNAANGIGVMGKGVAGAIARSGGDLLKSHVKNIIKDQGPFKRGQVYVSDAGLLKRRGIKLVYHAVTMDFPGGYTSYSTVCEVLKNTLDKAISDGIKSIALGGLGCGIGGLDKAIVAQQMAVIIQSYSDRLDITVVDKNFEFIDSFKKSLSVEFTEKSNETTTDSEQTDTGS